MPKVKRCPHCNGEMYREVDPDEFDAPFWQCIDCEYAYAQNDGCFTEWNLPENISQQNNEPRQVDQH